MPEQLIVITGAGASFHATCVPPLDEDWRPPLVVDLFAERPRFTEILSYYADAQPLAPDIRAATRSGAVGLESYLRDHVVDSTSAYDRRRYRSVPLYLQHLLFEVSERFTHHPVNYDRLINAALRSADEVLFLTLNYDTLLDRRLALHTPINRFEDYINPATPWSLIKLHGSVNWMREIENHLPDADHYLSGAVASLGDDLRLSDKLTFTPQNSIADTRFVAGIRYYPALSVPLGPDDEVNCPPEHANHAKIRLEAVDGLHILTIGYSGLDSALLDLLRDSGNSLRSLLVVNHAPDASFEAASRIARAFDTDAAPDMASPDSFNPFAQGDELAAHLGRLD